MQGKVLQVNISPGGVPKRPIPEGRLGAEGFDGDRWNHPEYHGGPLKAVLLMSIEVLDDLRAQGFPVFAGATGENLTTEGLVYSQIRFGDRLRVGDALIEITRMRRPCETLSVYGTGIQAAIYDERVKAGDPASPRWGKSGFYAKVLEPGRVRPNDIISVEHMTAREEQSEQMRVRENEAGRSNAVGSIAKPQGA
ncbi:MAG: MOSC domain-containing protein [Bryobacterales bacterium]|nr:MOSC domain-containing protein [Bryobacterales bacterium]